MSPKQIVVIGGGIIGCAIASKLSMRAATILIERNAKCGMETSSRNSQVLHAGLYYPKDSLKTSLTIKGNQMMREFCNRHQIGFNPLGKVICAPLSMSHRLEKIFHHSTQLGIPLEWLDANQLAKKEPRVIGDVALYSPRTAIFDGSAVIDCLASKINTIALNTRVTSIQRNNGIRSSNL